MIEERCSECNDTASGDEGYSMEGRLLCLCCFHEAVDRACIAATITATPIGALTVSPMIRAAAGGAA